MEYRRFSERSGVTLNETKTEILCLNKPGPVFLPTTFRVELTDKSFSLQSVKSVKICGITYSNFPDVSFRENVTDKVSKLKKRLLAWQFRGLSLGGKILIVKTFGISQLINLFNANLRV